MLKDEINLLIFRNQYTFMEVFFFVGIVVSFLLMLLVFSKSKKHRADWIFGFWQLLFLVHFTLLYIRFSELNETLSFLIGLDTPFVLAHIPFIFFYTTSVVGGSITNIRKVLHLFPSILLFIFSVVATVLYASDDKLKIYNQELESNYALVDILFMIQTLVYFPFLFRMLKRYSIRIEDQFSNTDHLSLRWLQRITIGAAITFFLNIVLVFLVKELHIFSAEFIGKSSVILICILQIYLGYFGLKYTAIFSEISINNQPARKKYDKTGISSAKAMEKFEDLLTFMEKEKPYLNPDLTLNELADSFGVSYNHLSQIINENARKNFYSFINGFRLEESIRLLKKEESTKYTILAIAYESGFRSKSVFNTFFKKEKGLTPSEFRKSL